MKDGISRVAPGGVFLLISLKRLLMNEVTLIGACAVHQSFDRAASLFEIGAIDPGVITSD